MNIICTFKFSLIDREPLNRIIIKYIIMKNLAKYIFLALIISLGSCTKDAAEGSEGSIGADSGSGANGNGNTQAGLITAGEWNDLDNWDFWNRLLYNQEYFDMPEYWNVYTDNRVSVFVVNNSIPVINAKVELLRNGVEVWTAKTDNFGRAELWASAYQKEDNIDTTSLSLKS